ncbi:C40 family peptidase [Uliginosibacterium sp. 31-16]|uniref:C40 family peptidase n=1 Tax=Uliginosibacterium sp. 31-16 TaxID=3068315 RepID=UPI0035320C95
MHFFPSRLLTALCLLLAVQVAQADDVAATQPAETTSNKVTTLIDKGFGFLGVRYRFGGNGPDAGGFDCSGLVRKVFGDALGLNLPRTAAEMARLGDKVGTQDLKPGDLVFFNTMRRAFSHVGIYLGDNKFLHAPAKGSAVRVEAMDQSYWLKRFNGGRRLVNEAQAAPLAPPPLLALPSEPVPQ